MRQTNLIITFGIFLILLSCNNNQNKTSQKSSMKITYPTTKKGNVIDTYFDEKVADPYRWLEDDRSPETEAWVKAQNKVTFDFLSKIPMRKKLQKELEQVWNYEKISAPKKYGEYLYFSKNDGLQNQWVIYRQKKNQEPEIFLNPNTFSKDGTTSLGTMSYTKDGKLLAYSISEGGSDWRKIIVLNTNTKKILGDTLKDVKFSGISWYKNEGFYYSSYDKPKGSELSAKTDQHKLYYHKLGTKQSEDKIIFGDKTKRRYVGGRVSNDNNYLIITAAKSTSGNELYIKDLTNPKNDIITILNHFDSDTYFIDNQEDKLFFETNLKAPNKRLVSIDFYNPSPNNWKDIISETKEVLSISKGAGYFFAKYMIDAISKVKQYSYEGKLIREIKLPAKGTANGFSGKSNDTVLYFGFTNYVTPYSIYQLDSKTGKSNIYNKPKVAFNGTNFESKQVFYTSKDGTKIPMIITYKKGITLNGKNPTILYGYGGFNISITPSFNVANTVWLNNGGIYAVANIRGGGEYGRTWHDSGIQQKKQNVFDDFITAAEYLIAQNYTSSNYLAIQGRSNGGLLVGAVLTQRPDLIKVALPGVGVLDMLRYHTFTAGAGWAYDYGTSEQSKEMFQYLKNYSPVHNVKKGVAYPATLITTGDHDDRVVPAHSFKFAAELQAKQTGNNPILIRIETNAGHGAGTPTAKLIQQNADNFAFTFYNMGIE
jgi:prolyl oligopeptidase